MDIRTKIPILFFILFFSAPCHAQQPRIDSIAVDEDKGELVLHGNFQNSASAIVLVDSVSLPVTLATDTLIRATIPVSGNGSAGWVTVGVSTKESNRKLLTYVHFQVYHSYDYYSQTNGSIRTKNADTIHVRADFLDINTYSETKILTSSKLSRCLDYGDNHCNRAQDDSYDTSGILRVSFLYDGVNKLFDYSIYTCEYYGMTTDEAIITFDNNFLPIPITKPSPGYPECQPCFGWGPVAPTDFPPPSETVDKVASIPNSLQAHLSSDPVISNADMTITLQNPKNVQIQILDILGHIISSDEKMLQAGINKLPINSSALPSGIYICRLQAGGEVVSVRFVKE